MLSIRWSRYSELNWKLSFTRALLCLLTISANLRFSWLIFVNISLHKISNETGAIFIIVMSSFDKWCSHFTINSDVYILILLQIINPLKNSVSCCIFDVVFPCCVYILTLLMPKAMRFFRRSLLLCRKPYSSRRCQLPLHGYSFRISAYLKYLFV